MSLTTLRSSVARRARRSGGRLVRRLGMLPEGQPDGLGEDDALRGTSLGFEILVFFPDGPTNVYQLRQWLPTFAGLDAVHRVGIALMDSRTARLVRAETALPVVVIGDLATLEELLGRSHVRLALYVAHHTRNFQALRFESLAHVYVGHGESDKVLSASNQLKAYDFAFVAGAAAVDRVASRVPYYDAPARMVVVGRPQAEVPDRERIGRTRPTVVYAPTWEGGQGSMAYGSVESHGRNLLGALLTGGAVRVVYRPHPRSGVHRSSYAAADAHLRHLVGEALSTDPHAGHQVDLAPTPHQALHEADLLITDVSSLVLDWLPTGRPLLVTQVRTSDADGSSPLLDVTDRLGVAEAGDAHQRALALLADDPGRPRRLELVEYYLGDTSPGASTARFIAACSQVMESHTAELERLRSAR